MFYFTGFQGYKKGKKKKFFSGFIIIHFNGVIGMSQQVAVIGSGAVGGYLAAQAYYAGNEVCLCVRTPIEQLTYEAEKTQEIPVSIYTDPKQLQPVKWVFLTTKIQDTSSTLPWLDRLVDEQTTVVVVQNGIDHIERVSALVPAKVILPAIIYVAAERVSPGHIKFYEGHHLTVPKNERGTAFAELLKEADISVHLTSDFPKAAWQKLFSNLVANPLTALTMQRIEIMKDPEMRKLGEGLLREALAVAQAEQVSLTEKDVQQTLDRYEKYDQRQGSSMMYDRLTGNRMEHEYITGRVVQLGEKHQIPTPMNQVILSLLRTIERYG